MARRKARSTTTSAGGTGRATRRKTSKKAAGGRRAATAEGTTARADLSIFNRYLARATGDFKMPQGGRKPARNRADTAKEKLARLDEKKAEMTAAQYLRKRKSLESTKKRRKPSANDLRARFLDALPRVAQREGWSPQDLQRLGVPYSDLVDVGLRNPRGPRPKTGEIER